MDSLNIFRFLTMLKENHIPAEYCIDLFSDWCSGEGNAVLAEDCMMIQSKYNVNMIGVWEWLCANNSCPNINWPDEVNKYKEVSSIYCEKEQPVLDQGLCFKYKGYTFEFSSCNNIVSNSQIIGLTYENSRERFPHGVFTDRYVCWMLGHKDIEGHTKEESDYPEDWAPEVYLVPDAWSWGAESDLNTGNVVNPIILEAIDKFLETFKE